MDFLQWIPLQPSKTIYKREQWKFFTYNVLLFCAPNPTWSIDRWPSHSSLACCYFFSMDFPIFSQASEEGAPPHPAPHYYSHRAHLVVQFQSTHSLLCSKKQGCDTALQADQHCISRHRFGKSWEVSQAFWALIGGRVDGGWASGDHCGVGSANCGPFGAPDNSPRRVHQMRRPHL